MRAAYKAYEVGNKAVALRKYVEGRTFLALSVISIYEMVFLQLLTLPPPSQCHFQVTWI